MATGDPTDPVSVYLEIFLLPVLLAVIAGISGSGGLWVYLQKRSERKAEKEAKNDPQTQLLLGLAYDRILFLGEKYIQRGFITPAEYEGFLTHVWLPYKRLGGNGLGEKIFVEVSELPLETFNNGPDVRRVHVVEKDKEKD